MQLLKAITQYQFLQNAFAACIMASVVCGIIGVITTEKKLIMLSGGIAHTSYGGIGLGYLLGFEPILGALLFSVSAAIGIGYINRKGYQRSEILISLFWSVGMALGILFVALAPGYPPELSTYLFGNILSVTKIDLYLMAALSFAVVAIVAIFFNHWKAYLFDAEFAEILGIKTSVLEYLILILIALSIVVLIKAVGIILVLALLTAPAAFSALLTHRFALRMLYAIIFGSIFCVSGLFISYYANIASGASIVLLSSLCFAVAYAINQISLGK
ncbi:MAG: metal ABC transporter permease [Firmicutes bacterium]|nr:metal ABC transporter permease [Bacillota bacterium]